MPCDVQLTDDDGYYVAICVPWQHVKVTVPHQCGGKNDKTERHAKRCCKLVMVLVIAKARKLWRRKHSGPKCIKVTTMYELDEFKDAFQEGLEALGPQLWSAVDNKAPDALKSCCFIAVVVLRIIVGTTQAMPLCIVRMYAAGELHILLPASDISETKCLKMALAYKESVPERLLNEHGATKKEMHELRCAQEKMIARLVELEEAMQKLVGSPTLHSAVQRRRQRNATVVGTPVAVAVPDSAAADPRSPIWAVTSRVKNCFKTPSYAAARIEHQTGFIEPDVAPIQSLLSRILHVACAIVALILSMCAPDMKAFVVAQLAKARNFSSLEPPSLEPSDSP